jgi:hypothetical protein
MVPVGTPRDMVLSLARERAATLVEGEPVDVRLDASREYQHQVEWVFSFTVVPPGGTAANTAR